MKVDPKINEPGSNSSSASPISPKSPLDQMSQPTQKKIPPPVPVIISPPQMPPQPASQANNADAKNRIGKLKVLDKLNPASAGPAVKGPRRQKSSRFHVHAGVEIEKLPAFKGKLSIKHHMQKYIHLNHIHRLS